MVVEVTERTTTQENAAQDDLHAAGRELLRAEKLVKSYHKRRVVNDVDIDVHAGEIIGLLGKNGAGKTTTFYMIAGLIRPESGKIYFAGREITDLPMYMRARMGMGYLCQESSVFRTLTVEQNIRAVLEIVEPDQLRRNEKLRRLLAELAIAHLAKQKAWSLSGGERRRVEIARALATSPSFIMLDEPFSGIDPIAVLEVQEIIRSLKDRGIGILLTDHNVRETLSVVDRAYIINEGIVECSGNSDHLINDERARKIYLGEQFTM